MGIQRSSRTSALWALACSLLFQAAACAISEDPPSNGQSHWLQSCDDDSDCGELRCECAVCTLPCTDDGACTGGAGLTCRSASDLTTGECASQPAAPLLCLDEAMLATVPDRQLPDAGTQDTGIADAAADAADASDDATASPPTNPEPLHLTCDAITADEVATEIEVIDTVSDQNFGSLTASDTAVAWTDFEGLHYRVGNGPIEMRAVLVGQHVLDGSELFFARDGNVSKLVLQSREPVTLGSDPTFSGQAPTPYGDAVYWASTDPTDGVRGHLWRSDREPGDTQDIGAFEGAAPYTLAVLGDHLYFAQPSGSSETLASITRARRDGSEAVEYLTELFGNLGNLISDGTTLFATISPTDSASPEPHLVVRVGTDGSVETLFETHKVWWSPRYLSMVVDDDYLYWFARSSELATEQSLWRARKDGEGEPVPIAQGLPAGETLITGDSSSLYLGVHCAGGAWVIRIDKPS